MPEKYGKSTLIKLRSTSDGLHLDGSILWFDSHSTGQLSFLSSSISAIKTKVPQVITTEETSKILEIYRRKPNALICQYNRPFSIGKLRMELLPSGCILGGASLYVETDKGRLLYAPQLQTHKNQTVRQMQLKKATSLILSAQVPISVKAAPSRKKEIEGLIEAVSQLLSKGQPPVILCSSLGTAQELTKLLSDQNIPLSVHASICRINKVYETYGSQLGRYSTYSSKRSRKKAVLWPLISGKNQAIPSFPDGPVILVKENSEEHEFDQLSRLAGSFIIGATSAGSDLREIISATQPKELFFVGPYAKAYSDEYKDLVPKIAPIYANDQPTLF